MKSVRVEVRFKNAVLYDALKERCGNLPGGVIGGASQMTGVERNQIATLINLQLPPWTKKGHRRPCAEILSEFLGLPFEVVFPSELYSQKWPRLVAKNIEPEVLQLSSGMTTQQLLESPTDPIEQEELRRDLDESMKSLSPVQRKVISMRFGLDGYEPSMLSEVALAIDRSVERVRQVEARAMRKLRFHGELLAPHYGH